MGIGGEGLSEQQLYDLGMNFLRTRLATVQGAQIPLPLGGKPRQVMVDIDPRRSTPTTSPRPTSRTPSTPRT